MLVAGKILSEEEGISDDWFPLGNTIFIISSSIIAMEFIAVGTIDKNPKPDPVRQSRFPVRVEPTESPHAQKKDLSIYQKEYWQEYKKQKRRVPGTLSIEEYAEIEAVAKKSGRSVWKQVWEESLAYRRQEVVLTKTEESKLDQIYLVLRGIGNNVNQMARHSNRFRRMISERGVMKKLVELEQEVEAFVRKPEGKE